MQLRYLATETSLFHGAWKFAFQLENAYPLKCGEQIAAFVILKLEARKVFKRSIICSQVTDKHALAIKIVHAPMLLAWLTVCHALLLMQTKWAELLQQDLTKIWNSLSFLSYCQSVFPFLSPRLLSFALQHSDGLNTLSAKSFSGSGERYGGVAVTANNV